MRWTWGYLGTLFSSPLSKLVGGLVTVVPIAIAICVSDDPFLWLFLLAAFVVVVQGWHAYRVDQSAPQLDLGEPIIGPRQPITPPTGTGWNEMRSLGTGIVVRIPVSNESGAANAESVYAELHFTGEEDQEDFDFTQRGRWRDFPNDQEITIVGNGRPNELDLFVSFPNDDFGERAYVWNQESLVAGVKHRDYRLGGVFRVEVVVRSNHPKALARKAWRVLAKDIPEIVSDGELFVGEKAAQEAIDQPDPMPESGDAVGED
jgi:hypothetical protein